MEPNHAIEIHGDQLSSFWARFLCVYIHIYTLTHICSYHLSFIVSDHVARSLLHFASLWCQSAAAFGDATKACTPPKTGQKPCTCIKSLMLPSRLSYQVLQGCGQVIHSQCTSLVLHYRFTHAKELQRAPKSAKECQRARAIAKAVGKLTKGT